MPLFCCSVFFLEKQSGENGGWGLLCSASVTNALFPAPLIHIHAWDACALVHCSCQSEDTRVARQSGPISSAADGPVG